MSPPPDHSSSIRRQKFFQPKSQMKLLPRRTHNLKYQHERTTANLLRRPIYRWVVIFFVFSLYPFFLFFQSSHFNFIPTKPTATTASSVLSRAVTETTTTKPTTTDFYSRPTTRLLKPHLTLHHTSSTEKMSSTTTTMVDDRIGDSMRWLQSNTNEQETEAPTPQQCIVPTGLVATYSGEHFDQIAPIRYSHKGALRYGKPTEILDLIQGSKQDQANYIRGLIATDITIFSFFALWIILLMVLKCYGPDRVGMLSGRMKRLPPRPNLDEDDQFLYTPQQQQEMNREWETSRKHAVSVWKKTRFLQIFAGISIIVSSLVMAFVGVGALVDTTQSSTNGLDIAQNLTNVAISIIDEVLVVTSTTSQTLSTTDTDLTDFCPNQKDLICPVDAANADGRRATSKKQEEGGTSHRGLQQQTTTSPAPTEAPATSVPNADPTLSPSLTFDNIPIGALSSISPSGLPPAVFMPATPSQIAPAISNMPAIPSDISPSQLAALAEFANGTNAADVQSFLCDFQNYVLDQLEQTKVADLQNMVQAQSGKITQDLKKTKKDLQVMSAYFSELQTKVNNFQWVFQIARGFALALAVVTLLMIVGVIGNRRMPALERCLRNAFTLPLFAILVFCCFGFSLSFIIASISLADFCFGSPDERVLVILSKVEDNFVDILYQYMVYYINRCPADLRPLDFQMFSQSLQTASNTVYTVSKTIQEEAAFYTEICGESSFSDIVQGIQFLSTQVCALSKIMIVVDHYLSCDSFRPLYEELVYDALCYNSSKGFFVVGVCNVIIVFMSMLMLTFRSAFGPEPGTVVQSQSTHDNNEPKREEQEHANDDLHFYEND